MQPLLGESLKEMCSSGKWCYAVFWAVCRQNPRLLTWEQYYNASTGCCKMMLTPASEEWKQQWLSSEFPLFSTNWREDAEIINKMMMDDHIVMVGEGLVGRAAFIGYHQWFLYEDYDRDAHPPEVSNDLDYQFSKGIKTVVVIPVLPHGVIRLGSTSTIMEDMEIVKNVKAVIHQLGCTLVDQNAANVHNTILIHQGSNSMISSQLDKSCSTTPWGCATTTPVTSLNSLYSVPTFTCSSSEKSIVESSSNLPFSTNSRLGVSSSPEVCIKPDALLDDQASNFLQYGVQDMGKKRFYGNRFHSKPTTEFENPGPASSSVNSLFGSVDIDVQHKGTCSFPIFQDSLSYVHTGNDLHDIFGGCIKRKRPAVEKEATSTTVNGNGDDDHARGLVCDDDTGSGLFSCTGTDHLLDAVVSGSVVKKELSPVISKAGVYSSQKMCSVTTLNGMQNGSFLLEKSPDNLGCVVSASLTSGCGENNCGNIKGMKSQITSWIEQSTNLNNESCASTPNYKKTNNGNRTCRKRPKTGENIKPRPKDRQLIQDRVRELRVIVPFGEKCSIDTLLEKTIRHMVFLQNVMNYGDILRQFQCFKICRKDGEPYTGINFNAETEMLLEVASQAVLGLIIVEDLEAPHLMVVEMISEETGFLFEISGIIRGLGLTILQGLMEIRCDKIRARFMVEMEKKVERMDVFVALVRLLHPTMKTNESLFQSHGVSASLVIVS